MARPLVSVLVPAYNHEQFVRMTLDSVVAETYRPLELLIRDDGSTDRTADEIERWIGEHPDIDVRFERQANVGLPRTLNRLLAGAKGGWIASLASDDEFVPGGIAARLEAAAINEWRAVFGDAKVITGDGREIAPSALRHYGSNIARLQRDPAAEIITRWRVPGPVMMMEAAALRELRGWSEDLLVEDWDLYLRFAARSWLGYLDTVVGRYRVHGSNISGDPARRARILADHRLVARRNSTLFGGRKRYALMLQRLVYQPRLAETDYGRLSHMPARLISKALRTMAEWIAG